MSSKVGKVFVLVTAISAVVLGGIHLGYQSEVERLKNSLDFAYLDYQQATAACSTDPLECSEAKYRGERFDRAIEDLDEARQQARLFLILAFGVPGSLLITALGIRRLSRSKGNAPHDERVPALSQES